MSLLTLQRDYLVGQLKAAQKPDGLYVLIIDERSEAVLRSVLTKDQLLRYVAATERIDLKRKKQPFMEAIYLIDLTVYNFRCIVGDVQTGRYKKGHLLLVPVLYEGSTANQFFRSNKFIQNPKINEYFNGGENVQYVPAAFHPLESRVFLVDNKTPSSMPIYYNENFAELVLPQIKLVARSLVNLMLVTGEYPLIRFFSAQDSDHQALRLSELIADEFQAQIDNYARLTEDYPPPATRERPRSILLICDRSLDLYAPLLHEFSYQALAMDIVPSLEREGVYKYKSENELGDVKEVEAMMNNEEDDDWISLRHLHIIEASELIINKINELVRNNPLMVNRSNAQTSSELMHVVAHLQGFDQERKQVTLHKTLIDECLERNASRKLAEFAADFEQTCAANGISFEGVRNSELHNDLIVLLAREDLHINDKIRLVLIYALYRGGLIKADYEKMAMFIGVNERQLVSLVQRCFYNLHKLGFPIVKSDIADKKVVRFMYHTINNEGTYNTSRFIPGLRNVLQNCARYQLSEETFPYFRDKPLEDDIPSSNRNSGQTTGSLRNNRVKASWSQPASKVSSLASRPKQRIFCYVAGGITYSEMRSVYELAESLNKDIYVGSETLLNPRDFLIGLQSIDKVKSPADLDLNLVSELRKTDEPPLYMFQEDKPEKALPKQTPPQIPQQSQTLTSMAASSAESDAPLHYQKRQQVVPESPKSPEKEKKRSRLKKLLKG